MNKWKGLRWHASAKCSPGLFLSDFLRSLPEMREHIEEISSRQKEDRLTFTRIVATVGKLHNKQESLSVEGQPPTFQQVPGDGSFMVRSR